MRDLFKMLTNKVKEHRQIWMIKLNNKSNRVNNKRTNNRTNKLKYY